MPNSKFAALMLLVAATSAVGGETIQDCSDCPEMIVIPAGSFKMGAPSHEIGRLDNEGPVHQVNIRSFALGKNTITRKEFAAFIKTTNYDAGNKCWVFDGGKFIARNGRTWRDPGYYQDDTHPAVCISWEDAKAYVEWLSLTTGKQYRLPTEAEWEYAARAGTTTARYWGDGQDQACSYANVADLTAKSQIDGASGWSVHNCTDGFAYTAPVGSFKPNSFGLNDMLGNVWQWAEDGYHGNYNGAPTDGNAWVTSDGATVRMLRGGSWDNIPQGVRAAFRNWADKTVRYYRTGVRVARTLP